MNFILDALHHRRNKTISHLCRESVNISVITICIRNNNKSAIWFNTIIIILSWNFITRTCFKSMIFTIASYSNSNSTFILIGNSILRINRSSVFSINSVLVTFKLRSNFNFSIRMFYKISSLLITTINIRQPYPELLELPFAIFF
jgi:hypothetical protein